MIALLAVLYLSIGSVAATLMHFAVDHALTAREQDPGQDPELEAALADLEPTVNVLPGGMGTFLLFLVVSWPGFVIIMLRGWWKHRG